MDRNLYRLLEKFIRKECTPEEAKRVLLWMQDKQNASDLDRRMDSFWDEILVEKHEQAGFRDNWNSLKSELIKLHEGDRLHKPRRGRSLWFWSASVAAGLAIIVAALIFLQRPAKEYIEPSIAINQTAQPLVKEAKKGEKNTFFLTDGTKIILNSDSRLEIEAKYGSSVRRVFLEGEAYFEVARNDTLPFQVYAGGLVTTALGTSFNIRNNRSGENVAVSLTSGKVAVEMSSKMMATEESKILNPGEEIMYKKTDQELKKRKFDIRKVTGWKDGVMIMDEANVEEVRETLENWYDIRIKLRNYPEVDWTFSGEFRNESLNDVLKGLQYSKGIRYKIENDQVTIGF